MVVVIIMESNFVILQHLKGYENYACDKTQTRGRRCLPKTFVSFYICECQIKSKVGTLLGSQRLLQSSLCKRETNNFLFDIFYTVYSKHYFENDKAPYSIKLKYLSYLLTSISSQKINHQQKEMNCKKEKKSCYR